MEENLTITNQTVITPEQETMNVEQTNSITSDEPLNQSNQLQAVIENELLVGTPENDQLQALDGDDLVSGLEGDDFLDSGSGNDLILAGDGNDTTLGQDGDDLILGSLGKDELLGNEGIDLILGEAGNDNIFGGSGADDLLGGDGDDAIAGGSGDDKILGEANFSETGNDRIFGGDGNDDISGVGGNDFVFGGKGDDRVFGGFDDDQVFGEDGNDTVVGSVGNDFVNGGLGNDVIIGSNPFLLIPGFEAFERDEMVGGSGKDTFVLGDAVGLYYNNQGGATNVSDAALIVDFNPEEDVIELPTLSDGEYILAPGPNSTEENQFTTDILVQRSGQPLELIASVQNAGELDLNADYFVYISPENQSIGTTGNDVLGGTESDNEIVGLDGNDLISSRGGNDNIVAGSGNDLVVAADGNDTVSGGSGSDVLTGGSGDDIILGGDGELDYINGDEGNDFIDGGSGIDDIFGGNGNDFIAGGIGNDRIFGESGNDQLYGEDGNDDIDAGEGNDTIFAGFGNDRVLGGTGDDRILGEDGDDILDGDIGNDIINGANGNDFLNGADGRDNLFAGIGNDIVVGGTGNDLLVGSAGNDLLNGEAGDDILVGVDSFDPVFGFGRDEVDTLTGGMGSDIFMLGNGGNIFYVGGGSEINTPPPSYLRLIEEPWSKDSRVQEILKADNGKLQPPIPGKPILYNEISVVVNKMPPNLTPEAFLAEMAKDPNGTIQNEFFDEYLSTTGEPLNQFIPREPSKPLEVGDIYDINLRLFSELGIPDYEDDVSVMLTELTDDRFTLSSITSGKTGKHPLNESREFGFEENEDGTITFYTRAVVQIDQELPIDLNEGFTSAPGPAWTSYIEGISQEILNRGGEPDFDSLSTLTAEYNGSDPISSPSSFSDLAIINDFDPNEDFIQLTNLTDANYVLASGSTSLQGEISTDLFLERSNQPLELIASFQGVTDLSLDESYFVFV